MPENMAYLTEWDDDQKMDVLFSPFRQNKDLNPHSWNRKMKFWTDAITEMQTQKKSAILDTKTLNSLFERKGKTPACLGQVIEEMITTGKLVKLSEFTVDRSWLSWSMNTFVKRPALWGYDILVKTPLSWTKYGQTAPAVEGQELVLCELIEKMAGAIVQRHCSTVQHEVTDNIVRYSDLQNKCAVVTADQRTFDLALILLSRQHKCSVVQNNNEKLVVFTRGNATKKTLSDNDLRVFKLKSAENTLKLQIATIEKSKNSLRLEAKEFLSTGKKTQARGCLLKKKRLDDQQEKKEQSLDQIQHLISMIQQAESNKQVLDAYKAGTEAFTDLQQRYGLTPDLIDKVMDGVQEVNEAQLDLEQSMSETPGLDYDSDDLESELEAILVSDDGEKGREEGRERLGGAHQEMVNTLCRMKLSNEDDLLPAAPTHDPASIPTQPTPSTSFDLSRSPRGHDISSSSPVLDLPDVPSQNPTEEQITRSKTDRRQDRTALWS